MTTRPKIAYINKKCEKIRNSVHEQRKAVQSRTVGILIPDVITILLDYVCLSLSTVDEFHKFMNRSNQINRLNISSYDDSEYVLHIPDHRLHIIPWCVRINDIWGVIVGKHVSGSNCYVQDLRAYVAKHWHQNALIS